MWLFGYSSLLFSFNRDYQEILLGKVPGFSRKFHQLSVYKRGTVLRPGRIATLVPEGGEYVCGIAYKVDSNIDLNQANLEEFEKDGCEQLTVTFYPLTPCTSDDNQEEILEEPEVQEKRRSPLWAPRPSDGRTSDASSDTKFSRVRSSIDLISSRKSSQVFGAAKSSTDSSAAANSSTVKFRQESKSSEPKQLETNSLEPKALEKNSLEPKNKPELIDKIIRKRIEARKNSTLQEQIQCSLVTNRIFVGGFNVIALVGSTTSNLYSAEEDVYVIARQIVHSKGKNGTNSDYLLQLANAHRELFPQDEDAYLFTIEEYVKDYLEKHKN